VASLGIAMAYVDARYLRIPNSIIVLLLAAFGWGAALLWPQERSLLSAATGLALLAVCFAAFAVDWLPGGDAKALSASALLIAPTAWVPVLICLWLMTLFLLLVLGLGLRARRGASAAHGPRPNYPFGVPIGLTLTAYAILLGP